MKYIIITDTHFGAKNNSQFWCTKQMDFMYKTLIPYINNLDEQWTLVHLGDVFDSRSVINSKIVDEVDKMFKTINEVCGKHNTEMIVIGGNHDYFSPENDSVSFLNIILRGYDNITLLTDTSLVVENGNKIDLFMPWYEFNNIDNLKSKIEKASSIGKIGSIFTHTDINFDEEFSSVLDGINVYAGHIHQPVNKKTWHNLGSTFAKDMSDANRQPGAYIIDENTFEMLYNNESVRFWKYNSIPDEAEQLKWNEHDIITFAIDRYTYEYKHEEIKQIKSKFALTVTVLPDDIVINNCLHCGRCLDRQKGCIVARSVITGGGNNMDIKNIDRYKTFGFRQEWLELYLEDPAAFWENDRLGVDMFYAFDKWAREILLIDEKKAPSSFVDKMIELGGDSPILWGYFYVNMAYNSPIVNWFIRHVNFGMTYSNESLMLMLGDELKERTRKNALTSLKDTLRNSPIGWLLGQGEFEMKGKQILSITKNGWTEPDPIVILYSLYMFAERMEGMYSFTLSDLLEDNEERAGLSPRAIFGIERETLKPILQGLANNYSSFIQVDFNKGIMENIDLPAGKNGKKAIDVLSLI